MYPKLTRIKKSNGREIVYLRLIEKYYQDGKQKERVIANLGRQDVEGRRALGELLKRLRRFTDEILVTPEEIEAKKVMEYGVLVVIKKLWEEIGLGRWIRKSCGKERNGLGEAGVLAMVSNRLIEPKSELGLCEWLEGVYLPDFGSRFREGKLKSRADRFYYTLDWLINGKEKIEEQIYFWARRLFPVDVVFYDITNVQFEGSKVKIGRRGYIRLGKKNHLQVLLGLVMVEGLPVAHYVFRGNRAEKSSLVWVKKKLKEKYNLGRVIFVIDRGMISVSNLEELEKEDGYIVAMKRRRDEEVKMLVESGEDGFTKIKENLFAKEVEINSDGKRRVICINTERAKEEKEKRDSIIQELGQELIELKERVDSGRIKQQKVIVSCCERILNKKHGKRYFSYEVGDGKFEFRQKKESIEYEEKIDGKFMIKTTEKALSLEEIVLRYKDLMDIEDAFRDIKDFIKVAPLYHRLSKRVKAHIFICVLALLVQRYMEKKISESKVKISSEKALAKLKTIKVVINQVGNLYLKYVVVPTKELEVILRAFGIPKLPKILSEVSDETFSQERFPCFGAINEPR